MICTQGPSVFPIEEMAAGNIVAVLGLEVIKLINSIVFELHSIEYIFISLYWLLFTLSTPITSSRSTHSSPSYFCTYPFLHSFLFLLLFFIFLPFFLHLFPIGTGYENRNTRFELDPGPDESHHIPGTYSTVRNIIDHFIV